MQAAKTKAAAALAASLLVGLEGYGAKPYYDSAGVLTDCFGNTHNVALGKVRTRAECERLLHSEAGRIAVKIAKDAPDAMTMNALAALVSWAYNVGDGAYMESTLRRRMMAGNFVQMCEEMRRWNKITVKGKKVVLPGLNNRREKEVRLCLTPDA